jgi:hypothetical protein
VARRRAHPGLVVIIFLTLSLDSGVQGGGRSEWQGDGQTVDRKSSLCSLWLRFIVFLRVRLIFRRPKGGDMSGKETCTPWTDHFPIAVRASQS